MSNKLQYGNECFNRGDYKHAFEHYYKAANDGDGEAAYRLGLMYEKGLGIKMDRSEAMKWYVISAGKGYDKAKQIFSKGKPETVKRTEIESPESVKPSKNNQAIVKIAVVVVVVVMAFVVAKMLFGDSEKESYATDKIPEYRQLVEECSQLLNTAIKDDDIEKLLSAKSKYNKIKLLDSKYGQTMPLEYNKSGDFDKLDKTLKQKCTEYCEKALKQVNDPKRAKSYLLMAQKFYQSEKIDTVLSLIESNKPSYTEIKNSLQQVITELK